MDMLDREALKIRLFGIFEAEERETFQGCNGSSPKFRRRSRCVISGQDRYFFGLSRTAVP
ncbi:MAG: hypothetical protein PWQ57_3440 [Desulfovibrionales bacterium]|nr:hypothetical protein [Desulfovibrionales bacterium]